MEKFIDNFNKILFYGLILFGIAVLLINSTLMGVIVFSFCSFIGSWLIEFVMKKRKIYGNGIYWMWVNIFLWMNILGEVGLFYNGFFNYDKIIHLFVGILITAIVYKDYTVNIKTKKEYIFFSVLGMLALWEIYEFILTTYLGYPASGVYTNGIMVQSPFYDSMFDMIFGSLGSLLYLSMKNGVMK